MRQAGFNRSVDFRAGDAKLVAHRNKGLGKGAPSLFKSPIPQLIRMFEQVAGAPHQCHIVKRMANPAARESCRTLTFL